MRVSLTAARSNAPRSRNGNCDTGVTEGVIDVNVTPSTSTIRPPPTSTSFADAIPPAGANDRRNDIDIDCSGVILLRACRIRRRRRGAGRRRGSSGGSGSSSSVGGDDDVALQW
mmetsp:Transcript_19215/g.35916  ORF Transcript_19215/g.35916 Transcript_19215/m.35916 type:complete len:114 (-) Transcript_19215:135-476(-)